jgi:chromosome partitioning protein
MYGAKVLFIDLDQQANLSFALGVEAENSPVWLDVVEKKIPLEKVRLSLPSGVDLIPSSLNNSVLDRVLLNGHRNWAQAVKGPLQEIQAQYDLIIIDTAPALSATNTAVTCASDFVILPINPDKFSLLGVRKHLQDLEDVKKDFDLQFQSRILFTRYDGREAASRDILSQCIGEFEDLLLKSYVRTSTDIKTHIDGERSIFSVKSNAKEDYDLVTRELLGI